MIMCLMLYIATTVEVPLRNLPNLSIEEIEQSRTIVREWLSLPHVRYIGSHSGCSCGFPSIQSAVPIEYFDGILVETNEREKDLRSVNALLELIRPLVRSGGEVQLYPVWDLEEHKPPTGIIEWQIESLEGEKFFFHEQFVHRVLR